MNKIILKSFALILFPVSTVFAFPTITDINFTQTGGPPVVDVKVEFTITDINLQAWANLANTPGNPAQPLLLTISGYEDDVLPFGDDLLGTFTQTVSENNAAILAGGGYKSIVFTHTFVGGVFAGGGAADNQYYLTLDSVVPAPVPVPAALWLFGSGLGLLGWMRRKPA